MKGVVLAGGIGSRLLPLTLKTNKHALLVKERIMVGYPVETLTSNGITDLLIVIGNHYGEDVVKFLGNGRQFGALNLFYTIQEGEGGIADALKLVQPFTQDESFVVILGDNLFNESFDFNFLLKQSVKEDKAFIFLTKTKTPEKFGIATLNKDKQIESIIEKPTKSKSNLAVAGLYIYPPSIFQILKDLKPSKRNELEISEVNARYLNQGKLEYQMLTAPWQDMGSFDAIQTVRRMK